MFRFGKYVEADEAFLAQASGDLERMLAAVEIRTNPVDRHFLLHSVVRALYRARSEPELRQKLHEVGHIHVREMPTLMAGLAEHDAARHATLVSNERAKSDAGRPHTALPLEKPFSLPAIETYRFLSRSLCEIGDVQGARAVWMSARDIGYVDDAGLSLHLEQVEKRSANHRH